MTKTQQKHLLKIVQSVLYTRRGFHPKAEETAMRRLYAFCSKHAIDPTAAMAQGTDYLKRHGIAVNMNGIV